jgi:hypothetical protein
LSKAAGGYLSTWNNSDAVKAGNILVSSNKVVHNKFLKLLKPCFKMIPKKAQEILDFWFKETPAEKRFKKDKAFDKTIKISF